MSEPKKVLRVVKIPEGRKQLQVTIPQDLVDSLRSQGVEFVAVYRRGEIVTIEPFDGRIS